MRAKSLELSRICAGFWRQNDWGKTDAQLQLFLEQLLELGVTTMDHAAVYQSETQFGRVLQKAPELREKMEIVTKCGIRPAGMAGIGAAQTSHYDSSPEHMQFSLEQSLRQLCTDYVDVLLVHRPDYLMDVQAMAGRFDSLIKSGKVRSIGVSNFTPGQFAALQSACNFPLVTNQIEFSPLHLNPLDDGSFDQCNQFSVNPMIWSCLAGGRIFSREDKVGQRVRQRLECLAGSLAVDHIEAVIYAWIMALPCRPLPIVGTGNIERVRAAVRATDINLTREQWYSIWEASTGYPVP